MVNPSRPATGWPALTNIDRAGRVSNLIFEANVAITTTVKDGIQDMIATIERKKRELDQLLASLKDALAKLDTLSPELGEMLLQPELRAVPTVEPKAATAPLTAELIKWPRIKQFAAIAQFLADRENTPATVKQLADAIHASRSSVANILYRSQKEAFESHRVEGEKRLRAWKLRPAFFAEAWARAQDGKE
jgi:hypothetical protein